MSKMHLGSSQESIKMVISLFDLRDVNMDGLETVRKRRSHFQNNGGQCSTPNDEPTFQTTTITLKRALESSLD